MSVELAIINFLKQLRGYKMKKHKTYSIEVLIEKRAKLLKLGKLKKASKIQKHLREMNVHLDDTPQGVTWIVG